MKDKGLLIAWPGAWLVKQAIDAVSDKPDSSTTPTAVVKEEEIQRVTGLVEQARRQGVEEIHLEISSGLASKLSAGGGATIEGMPMNVSCSIDKDGSGKYTMHVRYLPQTIADKLRELGALHREGVLTDEEFAEGKRTLLAQLHEAKA